MAHITAFTGPAGLSKFAQPLKHPQFPSIVVVIGTAFFRIAQISPTILPLSFDYLLNK
jgi:hypothetical protein